ncbi:MAG TPA: SBBP repeat-containing protein [Pyrinomonadaceae bacterium]|nr:SBBP repeat-containing protein [Pyrinomonadaceae bacterium]
MKSLVSRLVLRPGFLLTVTTVGLLACGAALALCRYAPDSSAPHAQAAVAYPAARARESYGRIPLSFEANHGQTDASVNFLARGAGYAIFLQPTEAVFVLNKGADAAAEPASPAVLRMRLAGANASEAEGLDELGGRVNYLVGNDPSRWRTGVPTYGRVRYREAYPGVDVVYYGNQRQLEYDFVVAPGRDPRVVGLRFEGADSVEVDAAGDLLLALGGGVVRQPKPFVYQEVSGERRQVEAGYAVGADGLVGFSVGEYDPGLPLVIDPVIVYSTYLGGSGTEDGNDIKVDSAGNAYVCGNTSSTDFPTANALQATFGGATFEGGRDGFITKLDAAGTAFVYSTYLGGSGDDRCNKLAVDTEGNAYVAGETTSNTDFPRANALQATFGGGLSDAFVAKLNASGSALFYSTYLGGSIFDAAGGIALDSSNNVYLTGRTTSANFPTANAVQPTQASQFADAFVTKINAAGDALVYSTYLGGSGGEAFDAGFSIAVDSTGAAYVTGQTTSTNFPTVNAIQSTFGGGAPDGDAFLTKVNAAGTAFVYSTYLGGTANDIGFEIAVDAAGSPYLTGVTRSTNFPTANALRATLSGDSDAFVMKLNPTGSAFVYSTYFGGSAEDSGNGIAVDAEGRAHVAGGTTSTDVPTASPVQAASGGGVEAFITQFNAAGSAVLFSTYLGGTGGEAALAIVLDSAGAMYVAGRTTSTNFPTVTPVQAANGGGQDAFITKIGPDPVTPTPTPTPEPTPTPTPVPLSLFQFSQATYTVQEDVTFVNVTVTRTGNTTAAAAVDYATADGTASERSDYTTALGTLRFEAGQETMTLPLLISEDSFVEGQESFTVVLSNPTGGFGLGAVPTATVQITDDATEPATNAIDDTDVFVGQHYHDFLNRHADPAGMAFWTKIISDCGANTSCRDVARINVSSAFFLSIEFRQTGYLVYRFYKETFTDSPERPRGMPRYREFLRDTQEIGRGVVVGVGDWEQRLEANKQEFARRWVQRPEFVVRFPADMTAEAFVDKLFQNAEVTPTAAERNEALTAYGPGGVEGRAAALRSVADSRSVFNRQFNPGFVLSEYFGYLRRNPDDHPDSNFSGFDFWLAHLDSHSLPGEDLRNSGVAHARISRAEMVKAFITSLEYRRRFGQ